MAKPKMIELALQGGGAHGAFTWGVLDRLLEDDRIVIEGISGTSAGAMNAVVVADGLDTGGKEGARQALKKFWYEVHQAGQYSPFKRTWLDRLLGRWTLDYSPGYIFFDNLVRLVSPYQMNPFNINPLAISSPPWWILNMSVIAKASSCSWSPPMSAPASRKFFVARR